jgi:lipopolysaccharide assembly outer membrane protein LptD (OstA)
LADAPANSFAEMTGTITSTGVVPDGLATVAGSLPASSASGTASVSSTIDRLPASGKAVKKNDVQFTPGLSGATAVLQADILEIDTKNREVAFNGEVEGARGRIDVLADFIELAPGNNTIEFEDAGSYESTATLRVYYRSGWLG